ncbi:MAG: Eaf protein [Pantoea sp. Morm]|uniref:DUF5448 family protein n=1 Tax=Pantoea sp. Morm TaxID=2601250 RepID=UPI001D576335|nr:Eaf protein [Pantoea sp. Morm]
MDYTKLNKHELADMRNDIEREQKRREQGPKVITYRVTSCMTEHRHFKDMHCALLCLRETVALVIDESLDDGGEYINKCTGIVGVVFRVEEVPQADFEAWEKANYYDDSLYEGRLRELTNA